MDIEKLIEAVKLCGSTPKVDQCKKCTYWAGGDMSKCIPRMTEDATTTLSALQAENAELKDSRGRWKKCAEQFSAGVDQRDDETERLQAENEKLREMYQKEKAVCHATQAELEQVKRALAMMWFAYVNSDKESPHSYETEALEEAERILGPWAACMPMYLRRGPKEG